VYCSGICEVNIFECMLHSDDTKFLRVGEILRLFVFERTLKISLPAYG